MVAGISYDQAALRVGGRRTGDLSAACSTTIPNNAAVTSREAWNSCRDIMIVLSASQPAACLPAAYALRPGREVARSPGGTKVGCFCACENEGR